MSKTKSDKIKFDDFLNNLKLLSDEPNYEPDLLYSNNHTNDLLSFISNSELPTPFVIGIDGAWGSGKTSYLENVFSKIEANKNANQKIIWFDAWKYEKYDPVVALYQLISKAYSKKSKKILQGLVQTGLLASDIVMSKVFGKSLDDVLGYYQESIEQIQTIKDELEQTIGKNGKLIVFVDDLDRCENKNILNILANIKEVLSCKNTIFVLGIDMKKIERAWDLEHKGYREALMEGREHVDKMFQLTLSVPYEMGTFYNFAQQYAPDLPDDYLQFFGPSAENPRKIKRTINTLYFLLNHSVIEKTNWEEFRVVFLLSILYACYKELFELTIDAPSSIFFAAHIVVVCEYFDAFKTNMPNIKKAHENQQVLKLPGGNISSKELTSSTMEILKLTSTNFKYHEFLHNFFIFFKMKPSSDVFSDFADTVDDFKNIIETTPFLSSAI